MFHFHHFTKFAAVWLVALFCFGSCLFAQQEGNLELGAKKAKHSVSPFLWEARHKDLKHPVYLFGAPPYRDPRTQELHPLAEKHFLAADAFVNEVPFGEKAAEAFWVAINRNDGRTLREAMGPQLSKELELELLKLQPHFKFEWIDQYRTIAAGYFYQYMSHPHDQIKPLSAKLWDKAVATKKSVRGLVFYKEQYAPLDRIPNALQNSIIKSMLTDQKRQLAKGSFMGEELATSYATKDAAAVLEVLEEAFSSDFYGKEETKLIMETMLGSLSGLKANRFHSYALENKSKKIFCCMNLAELIYERGFLGALKKKGYQIKALEPE